MPDTIHLELGPIGAVAVRAFVAEVDELLVAFVEDGDLRITFSPTIVESIRTYLTEWRAASDGDELVWRGELDAAAAEYLLYATYLGVDLVRRANDGAPLGDERSDAGRPFLRMLIERLHVALEGASGVDRERLGYLRARWPEDLLRAPD